MPTGDNRSSNTQEFLATYDLKLRHLGDALEGMWSDTLAYAAKDLAASKPAEYTSLLVALRDAVHDFCRSLAEEAEGPWRSAALAEVSARLADVLRSLNETEKALIWERAYKSRHEQQELDAAVETCREARRELEQWYEEVRDFEPAPPPRDDEPPSLPPLMECVPETPWTGDHDPGENAYTRDLGLGTVEPWSLASDVSFTNAPELRHGNGPQDQFMPAPNDPFLLTLLELDRALFELGLNYCSGNVALSECHDSLEKLLAELHQLCDPAEFQLPRRDEEDVVSDAVTAIDEDHYDDDDY